MYSPRITKIFYKTTRQHIVSSFPWFRNNIIQQLASKVTKRKNLENNKTMKFYLKCTNVFKHPESKSSWQKKERTKGLQTDGIKIL